MKTLTMTIKLKYDDKMMHGEDKDAKDWFFKYILKKDKLMLFSEEISDEIGTVKVIKFLKAKEGV